MDTFIAIDVETANNHPTSVCSIGAVLVIDGVISDRFYELVKPEPNYYFQYFTSRIHGLSRRDTDDALTYDSVWANMADRFSAHGIDMESVAFVAHNKKFDEKCLRACHRMYCMTWADNPFYCTCDTARRTIPRELIHRYNLPTVCDFMGIPFHDHHNALADAEACAKIAMALIKIPHTS